MLLWAYFLAVAAVANGLPAKPMTLEPCRNTAPSAEVEELLRQAMSSSKMAEDATFNIPTYVHLVSAPGSIYTLAPEKREATILEQIDVLNKAFAPGGFSFDLRNATYTENAAWATLRFEPTDMHATLRQGDYSTLNLYFLSGMAYFSNSSDLPIGTFGFAPFPEYVPTAADFALSGAYVWQAAVPGNPYEIIGLGYTAVHEVGHWLSLRHVFDDDFWYSSSVVATEPCLSDDGVEDTPLQFAPTLPAPKSVGCFAGKDTCPFDAGFDNVDNFMDYSADFCMKGFSEGQFRRMRSGYQFLRLRSPE